MTEPEARLTAGSEPTPRRPSRRGIIAAVGTAGAAAAAAVIAQGAGSRAGTNGPASGGSASEHPTPEPLPRRERVAGITHPAIPQRHIWIGAVRVAGSPAEILHRAHAVTQSPSGAPNDAGHATITIGYGSAIATALWPERAAAMSELPSFAHDAPEIVQGGDLVLQVCAETASAVVGIATEALRALGASEPLWMQTGWRDAPTPSGTTRAGIGFIDGIINPRTPELLRAGVWSDAERRDTHLVVRRMRIDSAFFRLELGSQERAIGRTRATGAPLSGGNPHDEVDLFAKAPDGTPLTPLHSHVRRAHPAHLGRPLMLRRSYSYAAADGAPGLLFIAFVADPQTFVATQRRLDEADELIALTETDASGVFFVPGES